MMSTAMQRRVKRISSGSTPVCTTRSRKGRNYKQALQGVWVKAGRGISIKSDEGIGERRASVSKRAVFGGGESTSSKIGHRSVVWVHKWIGRTITRSITVMGITRYIFMRQCKAAKGRKCRNVVDTYSVYLRIGGADVTEPQKYNRSANFEKKRH